MRKPAAARITAGGSGRVGRREVRRAVHAMCATVDQRCATFKRRMEVRDMAAVLMHMHMRNRRASVLGDQDIHAIVSAAVNLAIKCVEDRDDVCVKTVVRACALVMTAKQRPGGERQVVAQASAIEVSLVQMHCASIVTHVAGGGPWRNLERLIKLVGDKLSAPCTDTAQQLVVSALLSDVCAIHVGADVALAILRMVIAAGGCGRMKPSLEDVLHDRLHGEGRDGVENDEFLRVCLDALRHRGHELDVIAGQILDTLGDVCAAAPIERDS